MEPASILLMHGWLHWHVFRGEFARVINVAEGHRLILLLCALGAASGFEDVWHVIWEFTVFPACARFGRGSSWTALGDTRKKLLCGDWLLLKSLA